MFFISSGGIKAIKLFFPKVNREPIGVGISTTVICSISYLIEIKSAFFTCTVLIIDIYIMVVSARTCPELNSMILTASHLSWIKLEHRECVVVRVFTFIAVLTIGTGCSYGITVLTALAIHIEVIFVVMLEVFVNLLELKKLCAIFLCIDVGICNCVFTVFILFADCLACKFEYSTSFTLLNQVSFFVLFYVVPIAVVVFNVKVEYILTNTAGMFIYPTAAKAVVAKVFFVIFFTMSPIFPSVVICAILTALDYCISVIASIAVQYVVINVIMTRPSLRILIFVNLGAVFVCVYANVCIGVLTVSIFFARGIKL